MAFQRATKTQSRLRLALHGPSGAGKTYSALRIAEHLVDPGQRIALLDTEKRSARKYADRFDFDVEEVLNDYHPDVLLNAIQAAAESQHGVLIIDSGTLFWNGPGGFLELIEEEMVRQKSKGQKPDSFAAWKVVDPIYKRLVQGILNAPMHVILTLRAKTEYERGVENGKAYVKKVGMKPEFREQFEYEFDVEGLLDTDHNLTVGKTRCDVVDGRVFSKPGAEFASLLKAWVQAGAPAMPGPEQVRDAAIARWTLAIRCADSHEGLNEVRGKLRAEHPDQNDLVALALRPVYEQRVRELRESHPLPPPTPPAPSTEQAAPAVSGQPDETSSAEPTPATVEPGSSPAAEPSAEPPVEQMSEMLKVLEIRKQFEAVPAGGVLALAQRLGKLHAVETLLGAEVRACYKAHRARDAKKAAPAAGDAQ